MTDLAALYRAIRLYHDDKTLRLALADLMTENGHDERAEIVRRQIGLSGDDRHDEIDAVCDLIKNHGGIDEVGDAPILEVRHREDQPEFLFAEYESRDASLANPTVVWWRGFPIDVELPRAAITREFAARVLENPVESVTFTDVDCCIYIDILGGNAGWCLQYHDRKGYYYPDKYGRCFLYKKPKTYDKMIDHLVKVARSIPLRRQLTS